VDHIAGLARDVIGSSANVGLVVVSLIGLVA